MAFRILHGVPAEDIALPVVENEATNARKNWEGPHRGRWEGIEVSMTDFTGESKTCPLHRVESVVRDGRFGDDIFTIQRTYLLKISPMAT